MRLDHLVRLISQQWAIQPDVLENWCQILDAKLAGHAIPAEFAAVIAGEKSKENEPFIRDGNVAIVPLVGTLVKANSFFSCDATYAGFRQAVLAAETAKGIDAIVIDGDTPGGTVAGCVETGDFLAKLGQRKPLFGYVDDLTASAGYWLMAQTRMIGAHAGSDIGSIGVLTVAYDRSGRDKQSGVVRTVLAVGDFKAAGNDTGPLSKEDEDYIMSRLHATYDLFKGAVNRGRPQLSIAAIHDLQSRVYKAEQAKGLNLIDHVMGRDEYLALVKRQLTGAVSVTVPSKGAKAMDIATFKTEHPDLFAQIETEARAGMVLASVAATAQATAVSAESTRVLALVTACFGEEPGKKLTAIAGANLSADQAKELGLTLSASPASPTQEKLLAAITAAAPAGVGAVKTVPAAASGISTSGIYATRQKAMHRK